MARPRGMLGGILAKENADLIFLLGDLLFGLRNGFGRFLDELLRLAHIDQRCCAALLKGFGELQAIPGARRACAWRCPIRDRIRGVGNRRSRDSRRAW